LDNIFIFLKTLEEHWKYIKVVLNALYRYKLLVNKDKSKFYIKKTVFLGFEISLGIVYIEPTKIKAIKIYLRLKNTIEVQGFIGFANLY
jgi:hypothetical protein